MTFELEAIDPMYLNAYIPWLQTEGGFAYFLRTHLGVRAPSTVMVAPMSERLPEVLDRPQTGRGSFEEVIRKNVDVGRPDRMQLTFNCRVYRRTPGSFRTRVLPDGVVPSLHTPNTPRSSSATVLCRCV